MTPMGVICDQRVSRDRRQLLPGVPPKGNRPLDRLLMVGEDLQEASSASRQGLGRGCGSRRGPDR